jgi:polyisoprenoid-binding protein YceI
MSDNLELIKLAETVSGGGKVLSKITLNAATYAETSSIPDNYNATLAGPISVTGNLTIPGTSNLIVFESIDITGEVNMIGDFNLKN